jgi:four helix bundle protein
MVNGKNIKTFEDLEAWQEAHKLVLEIYRITKTFPRSEIYGIISQLRRAASSISANIAEGFSRFHYNDKIRFYYNSRGSISEVKNYLILSKDLGYIKIDTQDKLYKLADSVLRLINGLIRAIEKQQKLPITDYQLPITNR